MHVPFDSSYKVANKSVNWNLDIRTCVLCPQSLSMKKMSTGSKRQRHPWFCFLISLCKSTISTPRKVDAFLCLPWKCTKITDMSYEDRSVCANASSVQGSLLSWAASVALWSVVHLDSGTHKHCSPLSWSVIHRDSGGHKHSSPLSWSVVHLDSRKHKHCSPLSWSVIHRDSAGHKHCSPVLWSVVHRDSGKHKHCSPLSWSVVHRDSAGHKHCSPVLWSVVHRDSMGNKHCSPLSWSVVHLDSGTHKLCSPLSTLSTTSNFKTGTLAATLPWHWSYRAKARIGCPGLSILNDWMR